eukprot:m.85330 g.85330  ORF g.85330 m.85330 type:complete len:1166 (-) comp9627_c0_seq2:2267-5764(-)
MATENSKRRRVDNAADNAGVRSAKALYATPTLDELQELSKTESLFKSNLFKLQIDELLSEVRLRAKRTRAVEDGLRAVKAALDRVKDSGGDETELSVTAPIDGDVLPPIALGADISGGSKFKFRKPAKVSVIGSFLVKTVAKPDVAADLEVTMPSETFQPKDHLNHRYFHKRALYLAHLAAHFRRCPEIADVQYSWGHGSLLRPILVVRTKTEQGDAASFVINVWLGLPAGTFKASKLAPDRNNLRRKAGAQMLPGSSSNSADYGGESESATPHYNNAVLSDMHMRTHLAVVHTWATKSPQFADAILLLKVWLRQRGMDSANAGTLGGFGITMVLIYLLQQRKVFPDSSSFQMFRATVLFLASGALANGGCAMNLATAAATVNDNDNGTEEEEEEEGHPAAAPPSSARIPLAAFATAFDAVLVDSTGTINVLGSMSKGQHAHLQREASTAVALLDRDGTDGFHALFIRRVDFHASFDMLVCCSEVTASVARQYVAHVLSRGGDWQSFAASLVAALLVRALGPRAVLVVPEPPTRLPWPVTSTATTGLDATIVTRVGLVLDPAHAGTLVEKGPAADAADVAEAFRSFWGPKAELRRFADGSIRETVAWEARATAELVVEDIARYTLQRHAGLTHVTSSAALLPELTASTTTARDMSRDVTHQLGELRKLLQDMGDDVPLAISSLRGLSPVFRYAEPAFVPQPSSSSSVGETTWQEWVPALEVQLQFEGSSQWPEDVVAIQKVKIALYVKLAEAMGTQHGVRAVPTERYVDIFVQPYVFRVWIFVPLELSLARAQRDNLLYASQGTMGEDGVHLADVASSLSALEGTVAEMERFYSHLPLHTAMVHAVQLEHQSFCATVVLAKRWVGGQMLSGTISDEAIELLVASLYTSPHPYSSPPAMALVGFYRFIHLLVLHDWTMDPLVVVTAEVTAEQRTKAVEAFVANRKSFPPMTIFTVYDMETSVWTLQSPTKLLLTRLVRLAKASLSVLQSCLGSPCLDAMDPRCVFRADTSVYDALIRIKEAGIPRAMQRLGYGDGSGGKGGGKAVGKGKSTYKNLTLAAGDDLPRVDFDPPQLLIADLAAEHQDVAHFFYDRYGGPVVGVVWQPQVVSPHPFKAAYSHHVAPVENGKGKGKGKEAAALVHLNVDAVLENFAVVGGGLVSKVTQPGG